jgi:Secretion system C-terminal sorting domain
MKKTLQFVLVILLFNCISTHAQEVERYEPPRLGTEVYSLDNDGDTLLAYAQNGFWVSFNNGANWSLSENYFPPAARTWDRIEIENGVWYGVNTNGTMTFSLDQGTTWQPLIGPNTSYSFRAAIGELLFVFAGNDIYYTKNLGQNWIRIKSDPVNHGDLFQLVKFKDDYYYRTKFALYRFTEQDSMRQVILPDNLNISSIIDMTVGRDYLFILSNWPTIFYSTDGFENNIQQKDLSLYFGGGKIRIFGDPLSNSIFTWRESGNGTWTLFSPIQGLGIQRYSNTNQTVAPPATFYNKNLNFIDKTSFLHDDIDNSGPRGRINGLGTFIIKKLIATQEKLAILPQSKDVWYRSVTPYSSWMNTRILPVFDVYNLTNFNYRHFLNVTNSTIELIEIETNRVIRNDLTFSGKIYASNQNIYNVKRLQPGFFSISQLNKQNTAFINERGNQTAMNNGEIIETDEGVILQDRVVNKIFVYGERYAATTKDDLPCIGDEVFLTDGSNVVKFCNNEGYILSPGATEWRELRAQDWTTGTPLRFSRINHANYLNGRYWLGIEGKGLYYADDLSGQFYPYEVELPEKTPVAMCINYGKIWVAMRSGNMYSIQLPSVSEDNKNDFSLSISPNPTPFGACYLNANLNITTDIQLRIIDMTGKVVTESTRTGGDQWLIDIPGLPQGMYWIQLKSDAVVKTVKWVKGL